MVTVHDVGVSSVIFDDEKSKLVVDPIFIVGEGGYPLDKTGALFNILFILVLT